MSVTMTKQGPIRLQHELFRSNGDINFFTCGCSGFSGVSANFFPWIISWLCGSKDAPNDKREKVQEFLSIADRVIAHKV